MKFQATSRRNPCPVCEKTNGNCRTGGEDGQILCMTAVEPGYSSAYKFVKLSSNGLWGIHYPYTEQDFDREKWNQRKAEREQKELELERQRLETCLTPEQRDIETRKLLAQLTLNEEDYAYLLRRGVPMPVVERCRSVVQWQKFDNPVHVSLPGVSKYGTSLRNPSNGILIAIPDGNGMLSSLRLHDRHDANRKYTWLSSRSIGIDPRLPNKEYPIGYYQPEKVKDSNRIGVCEGMEWKAAIASIRLGFPVVGFSGNNFDSAMEQLGELAQGKIITIIPDAGSVANKNVYQSIVRSIGKYRTAGYQVEIAWWGQGANKKTGDIDEIDKTVKIEYLSVTKFLEVVNKKEDNTGHQAFLNLTAKIFGGKTGLARNAKRIAAGLIKSTVNHFYEPGFGARMYEELARQGHKWILDISGTGCGKTFTVSLLNKAAMFLQPDESDEVLTRLFYMPPSYRNPTNAKIEEEWHETAARNNGLYLNYSKQTELGNPYRESLKDLGEVDDHERTQSNCHKAEIFHKHYAAGRSTEGLCKTCDVREKCAVKKGDGFGYISEVKKWITQDRIRTSYQWLDKEKVLTCSTGLLFDEAGQVGWSHQITVELSYIDKLMNKIRRADSKLHRRLIDLQYAIADLVDSEEYPRHGYKKHEIMKALKVDKSLESDLEKILEIELDGRDNESEDIDPIFLYDLLRVALGLIPGSLSLSKNTLTIQIKNDRLIQACHAAKFVICQDATWSASMMAMALGIKESDIIVIAQRQEIPTNLVIEHWKGAGLLGNSRSESMQKLTRAIREQLMMMYPEIGFIDWKQHGDSSDLIHFGDSRGSNAYKGKSVVASIGLCRPNMTAILLEYEVMSGRTVENFEDEGFREYYGHAIAANLIQEIGRLRANRRQGEELKFILIGDGDIQFLEDLGFDLVECDAATKLEGVELGAVGAKARYLNFGMRICRLMPKEEWRKMSLRKAAEFLERAGSSVSRWVRRWFGVEGDGNGIAFQRFKELVYAAIYGGKTEGFSEDEETTITCLGEMLKKVKFCGQELGQELNNLIESCTWNVFLESVRRLENDYGIKLLARIFDVAINA